MSSDLELAVRAARAAGELLLERFDGPVRGLDVKSSRTDMVSAADHDAEALIRDLLTGERPDDGLIAEEGSRADSGNGRLWVVDPLDGTTNFLYGLQSWCVSIALEDEDGGLVGVVHQPLRDDTFAAERGAGATVNGEPLAVRRPPSLATALVATGFGYDPERRAWQARTLTRMLPWIRDIRRAGAAALDLAWVAAGRLDAYWERGLNHWDWAAGELLVSEAGGAALHLPRVNGASGMVAAHPDLLPELVALVESAEAAT